MTIDKRPPKENAATHAEWAAPFIVAEPQELGQGARVAQQSPRYPAPALAWYVPFVGRMLMLFALVVLVTAIGVGVMSSTVTVSQPVTKRVAITTANPRIHVNGSASDIRIQPIPVTDPEKANAVTVEATVESSHFSRFLAQRDLDTDQLVLEERNGEIYLDTSATDAPGNKFTTHSSQIIVYIPQQSPVSLQLQWGRARLSGLTGPVNLDLQGGSLDLFNMTINGQSRLAVHGGRLWLNNVTINDQADLSVNGGALDLVGALGDNTQLTLEINGGAADIRLPLHTAALLQATTDGGSLEVRDWKLGDITTRSGNDVNNSAYGYLSDNTTTKNRITLHVNGGSASILPQSTTESPPPATP